MWWLLIYPIIAILAIVFYYFSVQSRKFYAVRNVVKKSVWNI